MIEALQNIAEALSSHAIEHEIVSNRILVQLPNNFDTLVIEIWKDSKDSIPC
jgi:hypothetical protein